MHECTLLLRASMDPLKKTLGASMHKSLRACMQKSLHACKAFLHAKSPHWCHDIPNPWCTCLCKILVCAKRPGAHAKAKSPGWEVGMSLSASAHVFVQPPGAHAHAEPLLGKLGCPHPLVHLCVQYPLVHTHGKQKSPGACVHTKSPAKCMHEKSSACRITPKPCGACVHTKSVSCTRCTRACQSPWCMQNHAKKMVHVCRKKFVGACLHAYKILRCT